MVALVLNTSRLPWPDETEITRDARGVVRVIFSFCSIEAARQWAAALGAELVDTGNGGEYVDQADCLVERDGLVIHVIGTEPVPYEEWPARREQLAAAGAGVSS